MRIDIHTHTNRYSGCSILSPVKLVERAIQMGLDGIVITEHNNLWSADEVQELCKYVLKEKFVILRGQEIDTEWGHVLVFGYFDKVPWRITIEQLGEMVHKKGGVIVLAHPFRFYPRSLDDLSDDERQNFYCNFDALEVYNGNCLVDEIEKADEIASRYNLPAVGGSDAHSLDMVGSCCTEFKCDIENELDLARAIQAKEVSPVLLKLNLPSNRIRLRDLAECKGVLFDLYGTIVDIEASEDCEAFSKMALWLSFNGISIKADELMGQYLHLCDKFFRQQSLQTPYPEVDVASVFQTILSKRTGEKIQERRLREVCITFRAITLKRLRVYPRVEGVLKRLKEQGYLLGMVSNAQRVFSEPELKILGIYNLFDCIVFSSDIGVQKPGARIFLEALRQLRISPEEAVFIGNDLKSDIHGARLLNMHTILIRSNIPSHPFDAEPDISLYENEMDQVENLLNSGLKRYTNGYNCK